MRVACSSEGATEEAEVPPVIDVAPPAASMARAEQFVPSGASSLEQAVYVSKSWFERRLGRSAMRLLEAWWTLRDWHTFESFATVETAARRAGLSQSTANRARQRLEEAGLLVQVRWAASSRQKRPTKVRWIGGKLHELTGRVRVRRSTWLWLRAVADASRWGGSRCSAGRLSRVERMARAQREAAEPAFVEHEDGSFTFGRVIDASDPAAVAAERKRQAGVSRRARLAQEIVPAPRAEEVGDPVTPWPPRVKSDDSEPFRARMLANAYQGAVTTALKLKRCFVFKRGSIRRSKHYAALLAAAAALEAKKVAPATWAVWSCLSWKALCTKRQKKVTAPPVRWLFSPQRIEKHYGWCNSDTANYLGGKSLRGPLYKHFAERWARAVSMITRGGPDFTFADGCRDRDPEHADALERLAALTIRARVFPEGYDVAMQRVRRESERAVDGLQECARDGQWIWSVI